MRLNARFRQKTTNEWFRAEPYSKSFAGIATHFVADAFQISNIQNAFLRRVNIFRFRDGTLVAIRFWRPNP